MIIDIRVDININWYLTYIYVKYISYIWLYGFHMIACMVFISFKQSLEYDKLPCLMFEATSSRVMVNCIKTVLWNSTVNLI